MSCHWPTRIAAAIALTICMLAPCGTAAVAQDKSKAAASPLPPDYRQKMAQYILARNRYVIRDAKITKPYGKWGGIIGPNDFNAVCIAIYRDNPLGIVVRDNWIMTFDQGRYKELGIGFDQCEGLAPFTELLAALRQPGRTR